MIITQKILVTRLNLFVVVFQDFKVNFGLFFVFLSSLVSLSAWEAKKTWAQTWTITEDAHNLGARLLLFIES